MIDFGSFFQQILLGVSELFTTQIVELIGSLFEGLLG